MHRTRVRVVEDALDANNTIARANRDDFDRAHVKVVNLMSAPGAGKTTLLERVLGDLPGVHVVDFGIRGMDLAYAMLDGYDAVVLLDATPRGGAPGTLYVIEPEVDEDALALETHGMDPVRVLAMAQALGGTPPRTLVVGCEPHTRMTGDEDEVVAALSEPVRAALDEGERLVAELLAELTPPDPSQEGPP